MYCSACGSPIAPGLSFCNRCGMSLKERSGSKSTGPTNALVSAMVTVGVAAMGMLIGGPIAFKKHQFGEELIVLFMFLAFLIGLFTEIFLYRQLSRLTSDRSKTEPVALPPQSVMPQYHSPQPHRLPEPIPSVTENTTRTLDYAREERRK
ncbi:MAG TPA: zinc ribbon domain-containing protein [Pyrinomonadaceae bacterium]|nr:zinc ribbon domain-containing protein [Pyrinomonadaceae bacterium]